MSLIPEEALAILNHTIFRPGWKISARRPHDGSNDQVLLRIETETVDSSFVTRGGEYRVPLTEQAAYLLAASDYATPEALLFRVLSLIGELQVHEDREFLRTWSAGAGRWAAPFHAHVPEGGQAWERLSALPQPAVTRVPVLAGPCMDADDARASGCRDDAHEFPPRAQGPVSEAECDNADDKGDCWESGSRLRAAVLADPCTEADDGATSDCNESPRITVRQARAAGCEDGDVDPCWQDNKDPRAVMTAAACTGTIDGDDWCGEAGGPRTAAAPCNEQVDDEEGPQRSLAGSRHA